MLASAATADDLDRAWLAHYGAPLYGESLVRGETPPRVEDVFAAALALAHRDPSVARTLPVALWRQRSQVDLDDLARQARQRGEERTLGFFAALTSHLAGGDLHFATFASSLRSAGTAFPLTDFFPVRSDWERTAAEANTPLVAREWGYLMNMGLDSFESMFRKAVAR